MFERSPASQGPPRIIGRAELSEVNIKPNVTQSVTKKQEFLPHDSFKTFAWIPLNQCPNVIPITGTAPLQTKPHPAPPPHPPPKKKKGPSSYFGAGMISKKGKPEAHPPKLGVQAFLARQQPDLRVEPRAVALLLGSSPFKKKMGLVEEKSTKNILEGGGQRVGKTGAAPEKHCGGCQGPKNWFRSAKKNSVHLCLCMA